MKIYKLINSDGSKPSKIYSLNKTKRTVDLLDSSPILQRNLIKIRNKFEIPIKGYPKSQHLSEKEIELFKNWEFTTNIKRLLTKLDLPEYWLTPITFWVLRDSILTPVKRNIEIEPPKFNHNSYSDFRKIKIFVKEKLSKTEFLRLMDENWEEIGKYMDLLPKTPSHKMIRFEIAKEITILREKDGRKFSEIATYLQSKKKYIDSDIYDSLTEDYIKTLYYRLKKKEHF